MARGTLDEGRSRETRLLTPSITSSPPPWLLGPLPPPSDIAGSPDLHQFDRVSQRDSDISGTAGLQRVVQQKGALEMFNAIPITEELSSHLGDHNLQVKLRRDGKKRMMGHCVRRTDDE